MSRGQLDELVGDPRNHGDEHDARGQPQQDGGPADKGRDEHKDHQDDEQKAGAAARMGARILGHFLGLHGRAVLVGIDHLVLGAVVGKDAADIGHPAHAPEVEDKDAQSHQALGQVAEQGGHDHPVHQAHEEHGQEEKEADAEGQ